MGRYVKNSVEPLIRCARLAEVVNTKDDVIKGEFKRIWISKKEHR